MDTTKFPVYECFKRVRAAEIMSFEHARPGGVKPCIWVKDTLDGTRLANIKVDLTYEMIVRYTPKAGDFYIIYSDGYTSVSPRNIFFGGYRTIKGGTMQGDGTYKPEEGAVAEAYCRETTAVAAIITTKANEVFGGKPAVPHTKEEEAALADPDHVAADLENPEPIVAVLAAPFGRVFP